MLLGRSEKVVLERVAGTARRQRFLAAKESEGKLGRCLALTHLSKNSSMFRGM